MKSYDESGLAMEHVPAHPIECERCSGCGVCEKQTALTTPQTPERIEHRDEIEKLDSIFYIRRQSGPNYEHAYICIEDGEPDMHDIARTNFKGADWFSAGFKLSLERAAAMQPRDARALEVVESLQKQLKKARKALHDRHVVYVDETDLADAKEAADTALKTARQYINEMKG